MNDIFTGSIGHKYADGDIWLVIDNDELIRVKESGNPIDKTILSPKVADEILKRVPKSTPLNFK